MASEAFLPVPSKRTLGEEISELGSEVNQLFFDEDPFLKYRNKTFGQKVKEFFISVFPIFGWLPNYKVADLQGDIIGGLTITALAVPQDLAYAGNLAKLNPVVGLHTSFVPPLIYSFMGSSRHIAIGPVAVVSLLLGSLLRKEGVDAYDIFKKAPKSYDPKVSGPWPKELNYTSNSYGKKDKFGTDYNYNNEYYEMALTATFFAGIIQLGLGLFRLGFIIDFLSDAAIVGFMGGAAVTIGLQQIKGLCGLSTFTNRTDIVSVMRSVINGIFHYDEFVWRSFAIGFSFIILMFATRLLAQYLKTPATTILAAVTPLISVILATAITYGAVCKKASTPTTATCQGVRVVPTIDKGVNPSSLHRLRLTGDFGVSAFKVGIVSGLVGLTELVAIGRTFAAIKGYRIDGNKEMLASGVMNTVGSITSCYVATGSFSRSAVNFSSGGNTQLTGIIMSIVVLLTLVLLTPLFKYLPQSILSAIIMVAVIGLFDYKSMWHIWKSDKLDFLVVVAAFFGVIFISVEIGLLLALVVSLIRVILSMARPRVSQLGQVPGTDLYRSLTQYPSAKTTAGVVVLRIDGPAYFANAAYIREKALNVVEFYDPALQGGVPLHSLVLDFTPVTDVDVSALNSIAELKKQLTAKGLQFAISNPNTKVLYKLDAYGLLDSLGREYLFVSADGAVKTLSSEAKAV